MVALSQTDLYIREIINIQQYQEGKRGDNQQTLQYFVPKETKRGERKRVSVLLK